MSELSAFEIKSAGPPKTPRIQLYSLPTPNGVKASIMLEETGLPYEAHLVSFGSDDQMTSEFLSLNPNNKIPAMIDPDGPGGKPMPLWESGAILIYLAEKTGKFMPTKARYECLQWLMFQMGGVGPMFGQLGHFYKFDDKITDLYIHRWALTTLSEFHYGRRLHHDIATAPWVRTLTNTYDAGDDLGTGLKTWSTGATGSLSPSCRKRPEHAAPGDKPFLEAVVACGLFFVGFFVSMRRAGSLQTRSGAANDRLLQIAGHVDLPSGRIQCRGILPLIGRMCREELVVLILPDALDQLVHSLPHGV